MGAALPFRIDLFDEEIESIRTFDVDSQRTVYPVPEIRMLPAREFPLDETARTYFRQRFREAFEGDASRVAVYKDVSQGIAAAGIEYYLPLFFEQTATLFDYLSEDVWLVLHHDVSATIQEFWRDTTSRYDFLRSDRSRPLMPPRDLFLSEEAFFLATGKFPTLRIRSIEQDAHPGDVLTVLPAIAVQRSAGQPHVQRSRTVAS
jgi:transcription-repair coupling factor (superfamily II helicase)